MAVTSIFILYNCEQKALFSKLVHVTIVHVSPLLKIYIDLCHDLGKKICTTFKVFRESKRPPAYLHDQCANYFVRPLTMMLIKSYLMLP